MIDISSHLKERVGGVRREAVRADAEAAAQAEDVLLALPAILVEPTDPEESILVSGEAVTI